MSIVSALNILSAVISGALIFKYWYLGKGYPGFKRLCWIQIGISVLQFSYNILLMQLQPALLIGTMCFQPLILWAIIMSVKGLHATRK